MNRTPFFDAMRTMLARPFRQNEAGASDAGRDNLAQDNVPGVHCAPPPAAISAEGVALIKRFEGCAKMRPDGMVEAYPDPGTGGDPWTIGWGATGLGIGKGTVWTKDSCDARLAADLARYSAEVAAKLGDAETTQAQFDALVSFHYNTGAIGRATLTRKHIARDYAGAAREFDRWSYAGGRVMRGLARRREAEAALYRAGEVKGEAGR